MTDTPSHIKALQTKIWLSKSPMERLRQMMLDNEALFQFWSSGHDRNFNSASLSYLKKPNPISQSILLQ
jgi:hypothetical protein